MDRYPAGLDAPPRRPTAPQLAGRGFRLDEVADHGAQIFRGRLFNEDAAVVTHFDARRLAKASLFLEPDRHRAIEVYESMQQFLIRKYGPPENVYRVFVDPYEDGDGDEELAIKVGKAHFLTMWPRTNGAVREDRRRPERGDPLRVARMGRREQAP